MNADKAPANSRLLGSLEGGDAGRGRVERMSFSQLSVTHFKSPKQVLKRHTRKKRERVLISDPTKTL